MNKRKERVPKGWIKWFEQLSIDGKIGGLPKCEASRLAEAGVGCMLRALEEAGCNREAQELREMVSLRVGGRGNAEEVEQAFLYRIGMEASNYTHHNSDPLRVTPTLM